MDIGLSALYSEGAVASGITTERANLVANGDVKLVRGQVDHLTEDAVVLTDGIELPADLVVYATGYNSMNGWAADLISQEVADKVGKCWGLDTSGYSSRPVRPASPLLSTACRRSITSADTWPI